MEVYRAGTQGKLLATTQEQHSRSTWRCSEGLEFGITVDELMGALVDRLDSENPVLNTNIFTCLVDLLETGKHERTDRVSMCLGRMDKDDVAATKARWKQFLKDHGQALRKGKRFEWNTPEHLWVMYGVKG